MCAAYLKPNPRRTSSAFNPVDFNYQENSITYKDGVTLFTNQVINSQKQFLQNITVNGILNNLDLTVDGTSTLDDVVCTSLVVSDGIASGGNNSFHNVMANNMNVMGSLYFNQTSDNPIVFTSDNDGIILDANIKANAISTNKNSNFNGITDTGLIKCNNLTATGDVITAGITDSDVIAGNNFTFTGSINGLDIEHFSYLDQTSSVQEQINSKHPNITNMARLNADLIADGTVSNDAFSFIQNLSSDAQNQISANSAAVSINTSNIATNTFDIANNASNITNNTSNIADNLLKITTNTLNIESNTTDISTIEDNISSLSDEVELLAPKIEPTFTGLVTLLDNLDVQGTINGLDAVHFSYLDQTSSVQEQINSKHPSITTMARLDANLIADGSVSNIVFPYIKNLSSDAQSQISAITDNIATNTADIILTNSAIALLAPLNSAELTGNPTCVTQPGIDNSTRIASTAFVKTAITALVNSAPETMDSLGELAAALGSDPHFATTVATALGNRVDVSTNQVIGGDKTFSGITKISGNCTLGTNVGGNILTVYSAPTLQNGLTVSAGPITLPTNSVSSNAINNTSFVDLTNSQTVAGVKVFASSPLVPTASVNDNSTNVANTSFVTTAISNSTNLFALKASPDFTGTPTAPTAATATNTTQLATTEFVQANIITRAPIISPTFTGTPTAPTAATATNTTQLATTAFVQANIITRAPTTSPTFTGTTTVETISESISTATISSNVVNINYNNNAIIYVTGLSSSTNFSCVVTNIPGIAYRTYTFTLFIHCDSFKAYANSITINGISRTLKFSGPVDVSTAAAGGTICQQISVVYTANSSTPYIVLSNVSVFV